MRSERINCSLTLDELEPNVLVIKPFHLQDFQNDSIMSLSYLRYLHRMELC